MSRSVLSKGLLGPDLATTLIQRAIMLSQQTQPQLEYQQPYVLFIRWCLWRLPPSEILTILDKIPALESYIAAHKTNQAIPNPLTWIKKLDSA